MRFLVLHPILLYMWFKWRYASWALQHIPPLIDGAFNPEYQKLSDWINAYEATLENYLKGKL